MVGGGSYYTAEGLEGKRALKKGSVNLNRSFLIILLNISTIVTTVVDYCKTIPLKDDYTKIKLCFGLTQF